MQLNTVIIVDLARTRQALGTPKEQLQSLVTMLYNVKREKELLFLTS
jgi:hypothetical protein